jgi:hypothetical protein
MRKSCRQHQSQQHDGKEQAVSHVALAGVPGQYSPEKASLLDRTAYLEIVEPYLMYTFAPVERLPAGL